MDLAPLEPHDPRRSICPPSHLSGGHESIIDRRPVHHAPPCFDVVRADVVILEIVSVLPDIQRQQWHRARHELKIVLLELKNEQLIADGFVGEHSPAASFDSGGSFAEMSLEGFSRSESFRDRISDCVLGIASGTRCPSTTRRWCAEDVHRR